MSSTSPRGRPLSLDRRAPVLVLQGGGALGAYQAGVFEALSRVAVEPAWVAGVSIGAINAALIAGNAPERRVDALHAFWDLVSSGPARFAPAVDASRGVFNRWSAALAATFGVPGFYRPQLPPAWLQPEGTSAALGVYDTADLRATLERLVDFDRINARTMRLSVGAVDVETGNSRWFDNRDPDLRIGPEHIMASGALPPAFAPVEIDGRSYWDGGMVSNTPLQYVLDAHRADDADAADDALLIVQVDLFPARGPVPQDLGGVLQRQKDILYSSRSRYTTEKIAEMQRLRGLMRRLIRRLPTALRDEADVRALDDALHVPHIDIVHLIYRQAAFESDSKDYDFSRPSMLEHWAAGVEDMRRTHRHLDQLEPTPLDADVTVHDLAQGFDAAPRPATERDRVETAALERVSRSLDHAPAPKRPARASAKRAARER